MRKYKALILLLLTSIGLALTAVNVQARSYSDEVDGDYMFKKNYRVKGVNKYKGKSQLMRKGDIVSFTYYKHGKYYNTYDTPSGNTKAMYYVPKSVVKKYSYDKDKKLYKYQRKFSKAATRVHKSKKTLAFKFTKYTVPYYCTNNIATNWKKFPLGLYSTIGVCYKLNTYNKGKEIILRYPHTLSIQRYLGTYYYFITIKPNKNIAVPVNNVKIVGVKSKVKTYW